MSCSGSSGYQGYLLACSKVLPYLNADLVKVQEIIPSASIHGGGVENVNPIFRSEHNFALGRITVEGSVTTEVFGGTGNYAQAWLEMFKRAVPTQTDQSNICDGFNSTCKLIFSPGGGSEIVVPSTSAAQGKALVASCELRGNPGGIVQSTFRIVGAGADYNNTNTNKPSAASLQFETAGSTDDSNPIPYWASNFTCTGSGESNLADRIMDWNVSINNNPTPIFTFNGEQFAQDILLGMMQVSGSFTYYSADGAFVESLAHGAVITITFGSVTVTLPFVAFGASPIPSPGPNAPTVRNVSFTAYAKSGSPSIYYT